METEERQKISQVVSKKVAHFSILRYKYLQGLILINNPSNATKRLRLMDKQDTKYGFTSFAENWNGRLAMLGFIIAIATELLTGKGILGQLGIM
jgi:Chlorophyll A-B binding protein